jgi:signal transduction histidine kinase
MKNLVEELLLYSRPSRLTIAAVALEPFLAEVAGYLKAKEGQTAMRTHIPPSATVMADRDKLLQVFLNLINNALAAGGKNIDITVRMHRDMATIVFRDDGAGIREEDLERIFDPFFTTKREGTGLGLPICKKIVEDHGGTIQLQNAEGGGTAAVITLPA